MNLGSAVHTMVLEPHLFEDNFYVLDEGVRKNSSIVQSIKQDNPEKTILNHTQYECAKGMSFALLEHPISKQFSRTGGNIENSLIWQRQDSDVILKSRPDFFNDDCIIDLKTTKNASPSSFSGSIFNFGYHRQAALAIDGLNKLTGRSYNSVILLVVESKTPFVTASYVLEDDEQVESDSVAISQGRREYKKAIDKYNECNKNNCWPSYMNENGSHLISIDIPYWARDKEINQNLYYG
jgi:exodeoxyribonuclease VIII